MKNNILKQGRTKTDRMNYKQTKIQQQCKTHKRLNIWSDKLTLSKQKKKNCGKLRQNHKISLSFPSMPAVGTHGLPNQVPWGPTCWRVFRRVQ